MGRFSDILEENDEAWGDWSKLRRPWPASMGTLDGHRTIQPTPVLPCPSCAHTFATDVALKQHLFDRHRTDRFYVRVNGRPAMEVSVLDEPLVSAIVIPLGDQSVEVGVRRDGRLVGKLSAVSGIETELVPETVESGVMMLELRSAGRLRSYSIYVRRRPEFQPGLLDEEVRAAQARMDRSLRPDWRGLRSRAREVDPNGLERRYLEGFMEYLLAADLDLDRQHLDAGRALERAWGYLRPFGTELARSAIAIVAFRFDAYDYLTSPIARSSLAPVAGYLKSPPLAVAPMDRGLHANGIWLDDYQEALIAATFFAIDREYVGARDVLRAAPDALRDAAGNERKRLILEARIAVGTRDTGAARAAYSALRPDPMYADEAEANLQ